MKKEKKKKTVNPKNPAPVVNQLLVRPVVRGFNDIGTWRSSIRRADIGNFSSLFNLFEDMLLDGILQRSMNKRIEAVTNADLIFTDSAGKEVDAITDLIDSSMFEEMLKEIMKSKFWKFSLLEFDFTKGFHFKPIPRKHVNPVRKEVLRQENDERGIPYADNPNIVQIGDEKSESILMIVAQYVIYKRGGFGDWAQFVELFGMPQRIGKYNSFDEQSRIMLIRAFEEAGSAPYVVVPKESEIETTTLSGSTNGALYDDFRKACNEEMLITVLGQILTTISGDKGARALGDVHKEVEEGLNKADKRFVQRVLNEIILPLLEARGYPVKGGKFRFPEAEKELSVDDVEKLNDMIDIPASFIYKKFSVPVPEEGETIARRKGTGTAPGEKEKEPDEKKPPKEKIKNKDRKFLARLRDFFAEAPAKATGAVKDIGTGLKCSMTGKINLADKGEDPYLIDVKKAFEKALKAVYGNAGSPSIIEKNLFDITNNALQAGITKEFGKAGLEFGKKNEAFIAEFKKNAAVFAAFKNHEQTKEVVGLLTDEKGNLRSFSEFRKRALEVSKDYNENWLRTEYNTAVRSARSAANWKKYREIADLYPNLEYLESLASNKRGSHLEYVGTILPIDHPWWDKHMPPSDWNCQCRVTPTDKPETKVPGGEDPLPVFQNNPGKTAEFLRIKETPYYQNASEEERKEIMRRVMQLFADSEKQRMKYKGKDYKSGGRIETPVGHSQNSQEEKKNLEVYSFLAKNFGEKYRLLPVVNLDGVKNPDALNLTKNIFSDAKITETVNIKNAIQQSIKNASKQGAEEVVVRLSREVTFREMKEGLKAALQPGRAESVKDIIIVDGKGNVRRYDADKMKKFFKKNRRKPNK